MSLLDSPSLVSDGSEKHQRSNRTSIADVARRNGVFIGVAALVLLNVIITPNFLAWTTLRLQLQQATPLVFAALGMALVVTTKGIDISVGAVMAIASVVVGLTITTVGWPFAIVLALLAAGLCGALNGALVAYLRIQPIVATLAFLVGGRGLASVLVDGEFRTLDNDAFALFGRKFYTLPFGASVPLSAFVWVAVAMFIAWMMRSTPLGFKVRAVGANEIAARLSGYRTKSTILSVYVMCGVLAGLAGVFVTSLQSASDATQVGNLVELDAIAAVVVGGTTLRGGEFSASRTVAGAHFVLLAESTLLRNNVDTALTQLITGLLILSAVLLASRLSTSSRES